MNTTEPIKNLEDKIKNKLRAIIDPDIGQDIVSLGFVKEIILQKDKEVEITLELTTPACPVKETFRQQTEELIKNMGIDKVKVNLTAPTRNRGYHDESLKKIKSIVAISSCKGGVGKSTVAAILASELALRGFRVGLLDLDIFGPSLPILFGVSLKGIPARNQKLIPYKFKFSDFSIFSSRKNGGNNLSQFPSLKLMSFGFLLGDSPSIMRGPMVSNYIQQLLFQVDWGELDYLFIDMPPGTGDTQLTVSQSLRLDGSVIVTTPQSLSLVDVARGILMYEKVNVPILGIVENMSYFICDKCQYRHYPFSKEGAKGLQERFGTSLLSQLPFLSVPQVFFKNYQSFPEAVELVNQTIRELGKRILKKVSPPEIKFDGENISLTWKGDEYKSKTLKVKPFDVRSHCSCALCVDELTGEKKLKVEDIPKNISPLKIEPLGNYALSIEWSDGHSSGIYPYSLIEKIVDNSK